MRCRASVIVGGTIMLWKRHVRSLLVLAFVLLTCPCDRLLAQKVASNIKASEGGVFLMRLD